MIDPRGPEDRGPLTLAPILRVREISKRYGRRVVLDGFCLDIAAGEIHGLLGPNGSGKSTALHVIAGLIAPDSGGVRIKEVEVGEKRSRRHLGFAPDDLPLPTTLTGREYLEFHAAMRQTDDRRRRDLLVHALDMETALDRAVGEYSHGMKRKIQLIAAVCHGPELVILDEPFRGLDPDAGLVLRHLVREIARSGRAVLIATHDMLRAERDCDTVSILHAGATVAQGVPARLMADTKADSLEIVFMERTGLTAESAQRIEKVRLAYADTDRIRNGEREG